MDTQPAVFQQSRLEMRISLVVLVVSIEGELAC